MLAWLENRRAGVADVVGDKATSLGEPSSLMDDYASIKEQLEELGLFHDDSLLLLTGGENRVILDVHGNLVEAPLFSGIDSGLALFSHGEYSRQYVELAKPLRSSTDDMAQMFGPELVHASRRPVRALGYALAGRGLIPVRATGFLVSGRGFVVTGRYAQELIAAAILVEKACRAELLAPQIGELTYLNPAFCELEHAVYRAAYSRHERKATHG